MFAIRNCRGITVDTASTVTEAHNVVTWLNVHERTSAPFHAQPIGV